LKESGRFIFVYITNVTHTV